MGVFLLLIAGTPISKVLQVDQTTILLTLFVVAFTALAAYTDWRWGKLPNWLTVSCFATALVFHFVVGYFGFGADSTGGWLAAGQRLLWALLGFATGFSILFVLYVTAGGLGGDVKLMGAIGAWLMPTATLYVFLLACLFVAILMVGAVSWKLLTGRWSQVRRDIKEKSKKAPAANPWRRAIPFGVPVAFATWGVLAFQLIQGK
jgi:prepilin peptidase CpaA